MMSSTVGVDDRIVPGVALGGRSTFLDVKFSGKGWLGRHVMRVKVVGRAMVGGRMGRRRRRRVLLRMPWQGWELLWMMAQTLVLW